MERYAPDEDVYYMSKSPASHIDRRRVYCFMLLCFTEDEIDRVVASFWLQKFVYFIHCTIHIFGTSKITCIYGRICRAIKMDNNFGRLDFTQKVWNGEKCIKVKQQNKPQLYKTRILYFLNFYQTNIWSIHFFENKYSIFLQQKQMMFYLSNLIFDYCFI